MSVRANGEPASERVNRVHLCGCRRPDNEALALQLLGQAWLYREDLRKVHNAYKARAKARWEAEREASHVQAFDAHAAAVDEVGHVQAFLRSTMWRDRSEDKNAEIRAIRGARGHLLDAGTYWLVEEAMAVADKAAGLSPIRSVPFDGTGRIGVAIQSTSQFAAADTFTHSRVTLVRNPSKPQYHLLSIKVGPLAEERSIVFPLKLDRPFPQGSTVKRIAIQRVRTGHRFSWQALFTLAQDPVSRDANAQGHVGIDVGWRREPGERMRVATHDGVGGAGGERGSLLIDTLRSFQYSDAVRGFRDDAFAAACSYAKETGIVGAEHATQWRDKSRLHRLAAKHPTDLGLAWWRLRDRHLEDIECQGRAKAIRRRLDVFRVYADALAKRFRVAVLEDMPMQVWVGEGETSTRERSRSVAALSILQNVITHRFGAGRVVWVPAKDSTRTCSVCGEIKTEEVGPQPEWTCEGCGTSHHQDENAAIVLRRRGERVNGGETGGGARTRKAPKRQAEKKRNAKQKRVTEGAERTAREPAVNAAE